ncbi:MAG: GumC family protein [Isosphaeraceae bacterium]
MDQIVSYRANPPGPSTGEGSSSGPGSGALTVRDAASALPASLPHNPAAVKSAADYLCALRRRIWLVLVVAVPLAIGSSSWALRLPRIYQAKAEITIEPPEYNSALSTLVARDLGQHNAASQEKYVPNHIVLLQSKTLAQKVVDSPAIASELTAYEDPAQELILSGLQVRRVSTSSTYIVTLDAKDPALAKKLLETLLAEFKALAKEENREGVEETRDYANQRLKSLKDELTSQEKAIYNQLKAMPTLGSGGRNVFEEKYVNFGNSLVQKQMRINEFQQQMMMARSFGRPDFSSGGGAHEQRIAQLQADQKKLVRALRKVKRIARNFDSDPAARDLAQRLDENMNELDELNGPKTKMARDPYEMLLDKVQREYEDDKALEQQLLAQMQESMPEHQKFLSMVEDRNQTRLKIAKMEGDITSFNTVATAMEHKELVKAPLSIIEPTVPIKPSRGLYIAMGMCASFGLGIGLVVLLEHVDHSVKVPEHVTYGLTLPLLGVIPRIRRTASTHRGGHLWTPGEPDSIEADAFRNLRASLLGVADRRGPILSLLVTSPKAGDGKSTAALNLAATCARAGERTLLLDVDLRRPTLADVFPPEPEKEGTLYGLVDVLQGTLPWQKTLRHTELRNLDFIPTGDPRDIPIEILGTLELRQLLTALANHYDRVILDGPAVLGMADCRMLGRMVDASLLVIRAGAHQLVTLQRAKGMLEQSHVAIAGVIVNGLTEDVQNWSSYGYDGASAGIAVRKLPSQRPRGNLTANSPDDSLVLAGSMNT